MIVELLPPHTGRAFEAMRELRPTLVSREEFVDQVDLRQRPAGYRLVASLSDSVTDPSSDPGGGVAAVAGFRSGENLAWGRHLYVDDLSTLPRARHRGHAASLLTWLHEEAARLQCRQVHLDSGVGTDRLSAHRLYFGHGYRIASHHFCREV